ncbi:MAG: hypothetical protein IPH96_14095 [Saprospiraceae bacterium]|nr:hypothetical protein [Saprospiraceae bacterium]
MEIEKYHFILFLLLHTVTVFADCSRIKEFQSPTLFPYNGFIIVEATDPGAPFAMLIKGMTTGYTRYIHDIFNECKFDSLGPDFYEIEIIPSCELWLRKSNSTFKSVRSIKNHSKCKTWVL